jgi:YidC/Oxa1 family membrane protein insertase
MNPKNKKWLKVIGLVSALFVISGCTANFCSPEDEARIMFVAESGDTNLADAVFTPNTQLQTIITNAENLGLAIPSEQYWMAIDTYTVAAATAKATTTELGSLSNEELLTKYGYVKFLGGSNVLWSNWDTWTGELRITQGIENVPDTDFTAHYKKAMATAVASFRACISIEDGQYGPNQEYFFNGKTWGYAFERGLIEGLLVYPVAWMIESFSVTFGNAGWGQILAILFTTLIVRGFLLAATFKSTIGTQKMTLLQPDLAKIQAKYPNANTNQYEKQRLAQEQMEFYKKHGINPFSQILVMFFQFPIFIAVWGAMTGSAILATGSFMGLNLNASLGAAMTGNFFTNAWWTAIVIFLLMSASQFLSMKLPTWLQAAETKKAVSHTIKNPAVDAQQKQMKTISNITLIMIIVMGFSLPSAMGIYWFLGALISIGQTYITRKVMAKNK